MKVSNALQKRKNMTTWIEAFRVICMIGYTSTSEQITSTSEQIASTSDQIASTSDQITSTSDQITSTSVIRKYVLVSVVNLYQKQCS